VTYLFRLIDDAGNQRLQKGEVITYLTILTGKPHDDSVSAFLSALDSDGNGWTSIREWKSHMRRYKQKHGGEALHALLSMLQRGEWDTRLVLPIANDMASKKRPVSHSSRSSLSS